MIKEAAAVEGMKTFLEKQKEEQKKLSGMVLFVDVGASRRPSTSIPATDSINYWSTNKEGLRLNVDGEVWKQGDVPNIKERLIQFIPGQQSIFADERTREFDKKELSRILVSIRISNGLLFVPKEDVNRLKYLEICNYNASNPLRKEGVNTIFKRFDVEEETKRRTGMDQALTELKMLIYRMSISEVKATLMVLKGKSYASLAQNEATLVEELVQYAIKFPDATRIAIDSEQTKYRYVMAKAIDNSVIAHNKVSNSLSWPGTGDVFHQAPIGSDVVTSFVAALSIPGDSVERKVFEGLYRNEQELAGEKKEVVEKTKDILETLIDSAISLGVIEHTADDWYIFRKGKAGKEVNKKGLPDFIKSLKAKNAIGDLANDLYIRTNN